MTLPRRSSSDVKRERLAEVEPSPVANGLVLDLVDDPSASTAIEIERKRELVLQRQQQRAEAFERRRQLRDIENNKRDDERRRKDTEEISKKQEREQRRDEIYRQYLMKKENKFSPNNNDSNHDEHPTIKMRPKSSNAPKPSAERRQTGRRRALQISHSHP